MPPKQLSAPELRRVIEQARIEGRVRESFHASDEHPERNLSLDDVLAGLERADWILESTEYDEKHKNWKYRIKTKDVEGDDLTILLTASQETLSVKVITRW